MYSRIGIPMILVLMYSAGCNSKHVTPAELSSDLRLLISSAAEADLFIERIQAGKTTETYAQAHAAYLSAQSKEQTDKLRKTIVAPGLEQIMAACVRQQELLENRLRQLDANLHDPNALAAI